MLHVQALWVVVGLDCLLAVLISGVSEVQALRIMIRLDSACSIHFLSEEVEVLCVHHFFRFVY